MLFCTEKEESDDSSSSSSESDSDNEEEPRKLKKEIKRLNKELKQKEEQVSRLRAKYEAIPSRADRTGEIEMDDERIIEKTYSKEFNTKKVQKLGMYVNSLFNIL